MKSPILLLAVAAIIFSSCSTAYKTGQTPDDVYYSPAKAQDEYVRVEERDDRSYQGSDEYYEDRYLRMRIQNRSRWSVLDDYYFNSPYAYNYYGSSYGNYNWYSPYNSYWSWNNYYNPYYTGVVIIKNPVNYYTAPSRPVAFTANSYNNFPTKTSSNRNSNFYYNTNNPVRYNNSNNNGSLGSSIRKVFSNSNSGSNNSSGNNNNNNSTPSRSL
ncbi:MAG: hypothetical protein WDN26_11455 [Chitinophagaceae bacterium]